MIDLHKPYFIFLCGMVISLMIAPAVFTSLDEILAVGLLFLGALDLIYNRQWRRYIPLFVPLFILTFYFFYSLKYCHFNTPKAIFVDYLQHIKTFIIFGVTYALAPRFTRAQRRIVKVLFAGISIIAMGLWATMLIPGTFIFFDIMVNPYYVGSIFLGAAMTFMVFMDNDDWEVVRKNLVHLLAILIIGLLCGRSKYFGTAIFIVFMIVVYRHGFFARMSLKNFAIVGTLLLAIGLVAWQKFYYYFLQEIQVNLFDDSSVGTFARQALYVGMVLVLLDYPIFGSGFASFATFPSGANVYYSKLFAEYGLDNVWGMDEHFGAFIGDAFYPGLAQFGSVGIVLFIAMFVWLVNRFRVVKRINGVLPFTIGICMVVTILIDSVASRGLVSLFGEYLACLAGMILAPVAAMSKSERKSIMASDVSDSRTIWNKVFGRNKKEKLIYGK